MKKSIKLISVLSLLVLMLSVGCKQEQKDVIPQANVGNMNVQFEYVFGSQQLPWELGKTFVHPKTNDTLTFTMFRYYVSNIKLKDTDGNWWAQPESYFLVDAGVANGSTLSIKDIPAGNYTEMEYTMGVDSFKNVSGVYEGALSLTNGMFWDWNSGFIMLKAEGNSPNSASNGFALHLGGFTGSTNVVTTLSTNFNNSNLNISGTTNPTVTLVANPAKLWHSSPGVDSINVIHSPGVDAYRMAKDFYNGIVFKGIE